MQSTWEGRDLPVLECIVDYYDQFGESPDPTHMAFILKWDEQLDDEDEADDDVQRALRALEHEQPPFITELQRTASGEIVGIGAPTGHARRTVGAWPTPESLADRIIAALNEAAEQETEPDKKGRLKKAAEAVGGVGKDVVTRVLTDVVSRQVQGM
jgi:hypothetical protein